MTVYNTATLKNKHIRQHATEAFKRQYINSDTYKNILEKHPVDLYTPNVFVKIGLGILTVFITFCTVGFIALLFNIDNLFKAFLIVMGIVCYVVLEMMAGKKRHYNSGVDNILMAGTVLFISTGLSLGYSVNSPVVLSLVTCIICLWLALRFTDRLAAIAATLTFLSLVFNACVDAGEFTISFFPYVLLLVSGCIYYFSGREERSVKNQVYHPLWQTISVIGLLAFYLSGNYYVVASLTEENYLLQKNSALSFPWFFWTWTMAFPVVCLVIGIQRKKLLLIRADVILIAVSVLTFRYYYSIVAAEAAMVIAGSLLLAASYLLMQYLRTLRCGFVFDNTSADDETENVEGFVIGQTLGGQSRHEQEAKFGGGSFGGAGAGSEY